MFYLIRMPQKFLKFFREKRKTFMSSSLIEEVIWNASMYKCELLIISVYNFSLRIDKSDKRFWTHFPGNVKTFFPMLDFNAP